MKTIRRASIDELTADAIEQQMIAAESIIAQARTAQMTLLREVDRRQMPLADGCRTLPEWVAGRLDVSPDTAKTLVATSRRLEALPTVHATASRGSISYDRCAAISRVAEPSEDAEIADDLAIYDVAGIWRLAAQRRRLTRDDERRAFRDRYLLAQPNLDESSWRVHGTLPALAGRTFVDALEARADTLPNDVFEARSTRYADALWAMSLDSLAGGDGASVESATPLLTVFVDANDAVPTNAEAGVVIESGPRVGPDTLEAIICAGAIEVTARATDGAPLAMGRRSRIVPPRLRRFVLHRDGGVCTIEGCTSRYRLESHHIVPWFQGGATDAGNLTTLCWFHHHVVIHGRGFTIDPTTPPQRRRLRFPNHDPP
ncbi:MAG: DUF222 domain-containing protein [Actinomycetota bacterium]